MTIDEAIEEIQRELVYGEGSGTLKWEEALKLGIEALKVIKNHRAAWPTGPHPLLPGETDQTTIPPEGRSDERGTINTT
jgi:hypothetical protein